MKKLILFGLCIVLLVSYVYGIDISDNIQYWSFDENSLNSSHDNGNLTFEAINSTGFNDNGIFNTSVNMTRTNEQYLINTSLNGGAVKAFSFWINMHSQVVSEGIFGFSNDNGLDHFNLFWGSGLSSQMFQNNVNVHEETNYGETINIGQWHCIVMNIQEDSDWELYFDNVSMKNSTVPYQLNQSMNNIFIGFTLKYNDHYYDGQIDEVGLWNKKLSQEDVKTICSKNPVIELGIVQHTIVYPIEDEHINERSYYINASLNDYSNAMNCSINDTRWKLHFNNNTFFSFINNTALSDGAYSIHTNCTNATGATSETNRTRNFVIDITAPTITVNPNSFFDTSNNTALTNVQSKNVTLNFTFNDDFDLFAYRVNITNSSGHLFYNTTDNNTMSGIEYNFITTANISNGNDGIYNITIQVWDSHTLTVLPNMEVKKGINNLLFDRKIRITAENAISSDTTKLYDRYTFEFEYLPLSPPIIKTFYIESDGVLVYKKNSPHKAHFVDFKNKKWIDFDGIKETPEVTKVNDHKWKVVFNNTGTAVIFNSIGGLNTHLESYTFEIYNEKPLLEWVIPSTTISYMSVSSNISLVLNVTNSYRNHTMFYLFNSSKNQISNATVNNLGDGSYLYNHTFTGLGGDIYYINATHTNQLNNTNSSSTITIVQIGIDNCSTYTMRAVNISIRRDDTNDLQNTDINGYFEVGIGNLTQFKKFNLTWGNVNQTGICIYPNGSNYSIYAQFEYGGTSVYNTETHYLTNYTLTNDTQLLYLYLTPNGTAVTFTVTDQDDNDIENVYIHILRYDFGTNSHRTTEIIETDELGQAIGNIVLTTQWYKFLLIYEGNIVLETDPVKIISTSRNFRVNLLTNFFDYFDTWDNVQTSLTFTNSTLNFAYTFVNTLGSSVTACLNVRKRTALGDTLINETCITATSGTILVNIGTPASNTFIATGTIETSPIDLTNVLTISYDEGYKKWGKDGIFAAFFVRLGLSMIGIWNPMIAIILLILADIGMIAMKLYYIDWTTLIFYVILAGVVMYRVNRRG